MSEERSAKDSVRKSAVPAAEPLDDIILGDDGLGDGETAPTPPVSMAPSDTMEAAPALVDGAALADPKKDRPSRRGDKKSRSKMALRIPDDEVARPSEQPKKASVSAPPAIDAFREHAQDDGIIEPVSARRIITIEPPPPDAESQSDVASTLQMPALDSARIPLDLASPKKVETRSEKELEDSWTPFTPSAEPSDSQSKTDPPPARDEISTQPPISDEIPVDTEEPEDAMTPFVPPVAPSAALDDETTRPTVPRLSLSEEIKFEEDLARLTGEPPPPRPSETGEISAADVLAIDSLPAPMPVSQPPPMRPREKSQPSYPAPPPVPPVRGKSPSIPQVSPPQAPYVAPQAPPSVTQPIAAQTGSIVTPPPPSNVAGPAPQAAQAQPHPPPAPPAPLKVPPAPASGSSLLTPIPQAMPQQHPHKPPPPGPKPIVIPSIVSGVLAPPAMNDAAAARKRTRPWWEELFTDDFIRTSTKLTDKQIARETTFIEESLGVVAGAMILDLACGTGRHAIELTKRGYQVVGFDLSLPMLARAAEEAEDRNVSLNFVQGDMRDITFEETFDGIFSWNTSFGFFEEEKNAAVISRVHRALKQGGQFLLDVANRDYIAKQSPSLVWFEGDGCICMDEMQVDWITSRMRVKRTLMMDDARTKEIEYSIRLYSLHELGKLLHDHGFRVAEVSGRISTPGVFFGPDSPRTIILAEKR